MDNAAGGPWAEAVPFLHDRYNYSDKQDRAGHMGLEAGDTSELLKHDPFEDLEVPDALQESLERHRQNVLRLVRSLKSAGVSEEQIETSVTVIVASYKDELLRAIRAMVR